MSRLEPRELARELQKRTQHRLLISAARARGRRRLSLLDVRGSGRSPHSPLRYVGGKSRAVDFVLSLIPHDTERLCSPVVGGGSVELAVAEIGVPVAGYDAFQPLVNFWQHAVADPAPLAAAADRHFPLSK